jgi:hypothetical protein
MLLAEAVSISPLEITLILLAMAAVVGLWVAAAVVGVVMARRAGRGSRDGAVGWAAIAFVLLAVGFSAAFAGGLLFLALTVAVVGVQALFFLRERERR